MQWRETEEGKLPRLLVWFGVFSLHETGRLVGSRLKSDERGRLGLGVASLAP